jgi:hypothetical protein
VLGLYLVDRTALVSGETSVKICIAVRRTKIVKKNETGTESNLILPKST